MYLPSAFPLFPETTLRRTAFLILQDGLRGGKDKTWRAIEGREGKTPRLQSTFGQPFPAPWLLNLCCMTACSLAVPSSQPSSPMSLVGEAPALANVTLLSLWSEELVEWTQQSKDAKDKRPPDGFCVLQREGEVPLESLQTLLVSSSRSAEEMTMLPLPTATATASLWATS